MELFGQGRDLCALGINGVEFDRLVIAQRSVLDMGCRRRIFVRSLLLSC